MIRWTGLAPWEFEFPFPGSLTSTSPLTGGFGCGAETPGGEGANLNPTPYTLHSKSYIIHPQPYTLHPTPYTLHSKSYIIHPHPYTLHPTPYTLHPTS